MKREPADIDRLFEEGTEIDKAIEEAVRQAILRHKKLGESIVICRDGKILELGPDEIPDNP